MKMVKHRPNCDIVLEKSESGIVGVAECTCEPIVYDDPNALKRIKHLIRVKDCKCIKCNKPITEVTADNNDGKCNNCT